MGGKGCKKAQTSSSLVENEWTVPKNEKCKNNSINMLFR